MPKIKNNVHSDNDLTPTSGEFTINWIEQAECDHENDSQWDTIMNMLTDEGLPNEYRLTRLQLMLITLKEGLTQIPSTNE